MDSPGIIIIDFQCGGDTSEYILKIKMMKTLSLFLLPNNKCPEV